MKTTKEMIEVMNAFARENKTIQYTRLNDYKTWFDSYGVPSWDWSAYDYRIKPEAKKRPMTFDEIIDYWKEHRTEIFKGAYSKECESGFISGYDKNRQLICINKTYYTVEQIVEYCTKEDGSKFEVEE